MQQQRESDKVGARWSEEVRDEQGRRRFHGAFTGGFSAGYFNSVGSKEGWTPSSFASSRTNRFAGAVNQRVEDFMDEEDDPLLGKTLQTSEQYDDVRARAKNNQPTAFLAHAPIPSFQLPEEFVQPANESIGTQLLQQMGWKEGHGVGPRVRMKKRKLVRVPLITSQGVLSRQEKDRPEENVLQEEEVYINPRNNIDVTKFPTPKLDKYGAGFDPFVNAREFGEYKRRQAQMEQQKQSTRKVVSIADALKGAPVGDYSATTAYGLGALEENDDLDVYGGANMEEYDREIGPVSKQPKRLKAQETGLLMDEKTLEQSRRPKLCADGRTALVGFVLSCGVEKPPKGVLFRVEVPKDFSAVHHFSEKETQELALYRDHNFSTEKMGQSSTMTARQRAHLLGETTCASVENPASTSSAQSVFDMLGSEQRSRLVEAAEKSRQSSIRRQEQDGEARQQFRASMSATFTNRFVSAGTINVEDTSATEATSTPKKSYRSEAPWVPDRLLCKRFHVKCPNNHSLEASETALASKSRFDKEITDHVPRFLQGGVFSASATPETGHQASKKAGDDDEEVDSLPLTSVEVAPKPAMELIKSIFEPSDESEMEEEEDEDEEEQQEREVAVEEPNELMKKFSSSTVRSDVAQETDVRSQIVSRPKESPELRKSEKRRRDSRSSSSSREESDSGQRRHGKRRSSSSSSRHHRHGHHHRHRRDRDRNRKHHERSDSKRRRHKSKRSHRE